MPGRNVTASMVLAPPGGTFPARFSFGCEVRAGDRIEVRVGGELFGYDIPRSSVWVSMTPTITPEPAAGDDGIPTAEV